MSNSPSIAIGNSLANSLVGGPHGHIPGHAPAHSSGPGGSPPRLKLVAVSGSPGHPSRTQSLVQALVDALATRLPLDLHLVALSDIARDIGQALTRGDLSPATERDLRHIETADVLIAAAPVFRGGLPGHFKHLFDLIDAEALVDVPVLLAATGGSPRHALVLEQQLRPLFGFLQALTLPIGVYGTSSDFDGQRVHDTALRQRIELAADRAAGLLGHWQPRSARRHALSAQPLPERVAA